MEGTRAGLALGARVPDWALRSRLVAERLEAIVEYAAPALPATSRMSCRRPLPPAHRARAHGHRGRPRDPRREAVFVGCAPALAFASPAPHAPARWALREWHHRYRPGPATLMTRRYSQSAWRVWSGTREIMGLLQQVWWTWASSAADIDRHGISHQLVAMARPRVRCPARRGAPSRASRSIRRDHSQERSLRERGTSHLARSRWSRLAPLMGCRRRSGGGDTRSRCPLRSGERGEVLASYHGTKRGGGPRRTV